MSHTLRQDLRTQGFRRLTVITHSEMSILNPGQAAAELPM